MPICKNNDLALHYHEEGQGTPILFLSGVGARLDTWNSTLPLRRNNFHCIALDNRGVGRSDKPTMPYSIKDMASDAVAVLKHLNITSAHIVGQSMGGLIAQEMAHSFPDACKSITLCSTVAFVDGRTTIEWSSMPILSRKLNVKEFLYVFAPWTYGRKALADTEWLQQTINQGAQSDLITPPHTYDIQVAAMVAFDSRSWLSSIDTPTLVVVGDDDIGTPPYQAQILATGIPNAKYVCYKDAGHRAITENQEEFIQELKSFISSVEQPKQ